MSINYRYSSKNEKKIEDVIKYILDKNYGDTLTIDELSEILKFNISDEKEKKKFVNCMNKAKNHLIDKGYILKSIPGIGYYILKPKHIASYCYRTYVDRTKRLLEKSERVLVHVDKEELSDIRKKEHKEMLDLNREIYGDIGLIVESSDYGRNRHQYNNLKD